MTSLAVLLTNDIACTSLLIKEPAADAGAVDRQTVDISIMYCSTFSSFLKQFASETVTVHYQQLGLFNNCASAVQWCKNYRIDLDLKQCRI